MDCSICQELKDKRRKLRPIIQEYRLRWIRGNYRQTNLCEVHSTLVYGGVPTLEQEESMEGKWPRS